MNRRALLQSLGLGAAGLLATSELDWERLLWKPKPIITVPALHGKGIVRAWVGGREYMFRNWSLTQPAAIRFEPDDAYRMIGPVHVEADIAIPGVPLIRKTCVQTNPYEGRTLDPKCALTYTWSGPLVEYR
jgi:hypothetical protein